MSDGKRRIRGAVGLGLDTAEGVSRYVERTRERAFARAGVRMPAPVPPVALGPDVMAAMQRAVRSALESTVSLAPEDLPSGTPWLDDVESVFNGLYGDRLAERGNGLDVGMGVRLAGRAFRTVEDLGELELGERAVIFIHGLAVHEGYWGVDRRSPELPETCFGRRAREELGLDPLFVRYNTGRHIADSGASLAELLDRLVTAHPQLRSIDLVGHSMGGLVARSAAHQMDREETEARFGLRTIVCIGSPHLGAPLARVAQSVSAILRRMPASAEGVPGGFGPPSAGIRDLVHGEVERRSGPDDTTPPTRELPVLDGVWTYCIAGVARGEARGPLGRVFGDWMVPTASATGVDGARAIPFDGGEVVEGVDHVALTTDERVWKALRRFLAEEPDAPTA